MKFTGLLTLTVLLATLTTTLADDKVGDSKAQCDKCEKKCDSECEKKCEKGCEKKCCEKTCEGQVCCHDPSGTWVWESEVAGNFIESRLKLVLCGRDRLTGEYSDQNVSVEIQDGAIDEGKVTFTLDFSVDGNDVQAKFCGTVKGDTLKGTTAVTLNGESFDLPVDARRRTSRRDVTGTWKVNVETDSGEVFEPTVTIRLEKGKLAGTYVDQAAGRHALQDVILKDNVLSFRIEGEAEDGSTFRATFRGKPRGDRLEGKADVVINGTQITAAVRGQREQEKSDQS